MDAIFADDSRQKKPSRRGMSKPLIGIGGLHLPGAQAGPFEKAVQAHCDSIGFPREEQFKWSPGKKEKFQRKTLNDSDRIDFFCHLLDLAKQHSATASVVISDTNYNTAIAKSQSHEIDVTTLFLERADWSLRASGADGIVFIAKPSGGRKEEAKFVAECVQLLAEGTTYTGFSRLPLGVVTAPSRHMRSLQLADIVSSCSMARISGESNFSPRVFPHVRPLLRSDGTRTGGVGLKLHPDAVYANLYHWLLGDTTWWKGTTGTKLPAPHMEYANEQGE